MFEISHGDAGVVVFQGRLDAAQCAKAQAFLDAIDAPKVLDFAKLEYISSAGLGVLLKTQKRVMGSSGRLKLTRTRGGSMRLVGKDDRVLKVFSITGLDKVFEILPDLDAALAADERAASERSS